MIGPPRKGSRREEMEERRRSSARASISIRRVSRKSSIREEMAERRRGSTRASKMIKFTAKSNLTAKPPSEPLVVRSSVRPSSRRGRLQAKQEGGEMQDNAPAGAGGGVGAVESPGEAPTAPGGADVGQGELSDKENSTRKGEVELLGGDNMLSVVVKVKGVVANDSGTDFDRPVLASDIALTRESQQIAREVEQLPGARNSQQIPRDSTLIPRNQQQLYRPKSERSLTAESDSDRDVDTSAKADNDGEASRRRKEGAEPSTSTQEASPTLASLPVAANPDPNPEPEEAEASEGGEDVVTGLDCLQRSIEGSLDCSQTPIVEEEEGQEEGPEPELQAPKRGEVGGGGGGRGGDGDGGKVPSVRKRESTTAQEVAKKRGSVRTSKVIGTYEDSVTATNVTNMRPSARMRLRAERTIETGNRASQVVRVTAPIGARKHPRRDSSDKSDRRGSSSRAGESTMEEGPSEEKKKQKEEEKEEEEEQEEQEENEQAEEDKSTERRRAEKAVKAEAGRKAGLAAKVVKKITAGLTVRNKADKWRETTEAQVRGHEVEAGVVEKVQVALPTPLRKAHFSIGKVLGMGGYGLVRLARHNSTQTVWAIKSMLKREILEANMAGYAEEERKVLCSLVSPFIAQMAGTFQDERKIYIAMDYARGGELYKILLHKKQFEEHEVRFYGCEIALVLHHIHQSNVMHRDMKMENLLVDGRGHLKLVDFGFAKVLPEGAVTYSMFGTPEYVAPELLTSTGHGHMVDWWAFGILLFEMFTGVTPFASADVNAMYDAIMWDEVDFPDNIPAPARSLIKGLLAKKHNKRLGSKRKGGIQGIKSHPWFSSVRWDRVEARKVRAPEAMLNMVGCIDDDISADAQEQWDDALFEPCQDAIDIEEEDMLTEPFDWKTEQSGLLEDPFRNF